MSSVSINPQGTYALPNSGREAQDLTESAVQVLNGESKPDLILPRELLIVNSFVKSVLDRAAVDHSKSSESGVEALIARLRWKPIIYGVAHQQVMSAGCSDIPIHEDYFIKVRYHIVLNLSRMSSDKVGDGLTVLTVDIDDPSLLYVRTRCWKLNNGRNVPYYIKDNRTSGSIADRLKEMVPILRDWIAKNREDYEDDVLVRLELPTDPSGKTQFDALDRSAKTSVPNRFALRWVFSSKVAARLDGK